LWSACRSLLIQTGEKCEVKSATLLLLCVLYVGLVYVWHECLERRSNCVSHQETRSWKGSLTKAILTLATPTFGNEPYCRAASSSGHRLVLQELFSAQDSGSQQLRMPTGAIKSLHDPFPGAPRSLVRGRRFFTSSGPYLVRSHRQSSILTDSWASHT